MFGERMVGHDGFEPSTNGLKVRFGLFSARITRGFQAFFLFVTLFVTLFLWYFQLNIKIWSNGFHKK